jgi:transposase-like protein
MFVNAKGRKRAAGRLETTREAVLRLMEQGLSQAEIARQLGLTKSTVAYHFRNLGVAADERFARRYDWDEIQRAYDGGLSIRQCAERFGFNLATWFQARGRGEVVARPRAMPIEDLLVAASSHQRPWEGQSARKPRVSLPELPRPDRELGRPERHSRRVVLT